jgi:biotin carboxyl carrier protein
MGGSVADGMPKGRVVSLDVRDQRNGLAGQGRQPRKRAWRRWWLGGVLVVGLVASLAVLRAQSPAAPTVAPVTNSALLAHGQIMPAIRAQVGTIAGGTVHAVAVAPGTVTAERAELARVEGPTGTEVITAPFSGTVTNVLVHAGDTLLAGAAVAVVVDPRTLQVETSDVDQFLIGRVSAGQIVRVTVDALDNVAVLGTIRSVAGLPQPDGNGGQHYPVVITPAGLPAAARAGISVRVMLTD